MRLKLKNLDFDAGRPVCFINENTAKRADIHVGDRIEVSFNGKKTISIVDLVKGFVKEDELSLSKEVIKYFKVKPGASIEVSQTFEPASIEFISKKMNGIELSKKEIHAIITDIVSNALTEAEISYFILGVYEKGMTMKETIYLTEAMYKTGQVLQWPSHYKIVDKHSIGGIPGNRTTPIVVSICAALGIVIPKTSSRAITSAAGTADTIETICNVDFDVLNLKKIVGKTNACFVWGGALDLAPADDKLIRVERMLNLDPESQLIASIISKKLAVGAKYLIIDIPCGVGAKVTKTEAKKLKLKFLKVTQHFNLKTRIVLTDGSQPIGQGVGPVLEMRDVIKVLKRESSSTDLEKKSVMLAGQIFEMMGKAEKGKGFALALETLNSKKALRKFQEIVNTQGRSKGGLKLSKYNYIIKSSKHGKITHINNKEINHLARLLGCPVDKGSGIFLHKHKNMTIGKKEPLVTFYSESEKKLNEAIEHFYLSNPFTIK